MRLYTFTNMYLSDIQRGIQTAHIVSELHNEYSALYDEWAHSHKTIIVLNGGYSSTLQAIYDLFANTRNDHKFPFAKFHEEDAALNGALTAVGIVLPEYIYTISSHLRSNRITELDDAKSLFQLSPTGTIPLVKIDFHEYITELLGETSEAELSLGETKRISEAELSIALELTKYNLA